MISSPVRRLLAYFVEGIAVFIIFMVAALLMGIPYKAFLDSSSSIVHTGYAMYILFLIVGMFVVNIFFWTQSTTLGKAIMGMKIVNADTKEDVGFFRIMFREVIGKAISPLFFGLGYIWILIDGNNQGWHDKIFNTLVIDK